MIGERTFYGDAQYQELTGDVDLNPRLYRTHDFEADANGHDVNLPDPDAGKLEAGGPYFNLVNIDGTNNLDVVDHNASALDTLDANETAFVLLGKNVTGDKTWYCSAPAETAHDGNVIDHNPSTYWKDSLLNAFNANLQHLYVMDMASGDAVDSIGSDNIPAIGSGKNYQQAGKINGQTCVEITASGGGFEKTGWTGLAGKNFTIAVWVKSTTTNVFEFLNWMASSTVIAKWNPETNAQKFTLGNPTPAFGMRAEISGTPQYQLDHAGATAIALNGVWNHLAIRRENDDSFTTIVNGTELVNSVSVIDTLDIGGDGFNIGNKSGTGWKGFVQQMGLWNTQISTAALRRLWNGGAGRRYFP